MAGFFTDLAKSFVEQGINRAIGESRYICCFRSIAEEFEQNRASLEAERKTLVQRVQVATRKGEDVQDNARHWEVEVEKLIEKDTNTEKKCFFGLSPNCIWRYRRGKELAEKTKLIKTMKEKGEKLESVGLPGRPPDIDRHSSQYYISFESRKLKYKQLLDALKNESNYLTGLYGMGGTGKTILANEVGKELKQCKEFSQVIDTTVSFTVDIKKIQDDIASSLGLEWGENCNESDRPKKLWNRLTNGEKILVILDDVWDPDPRVLNPPLDFDVIGIPGKDNHKGCRVLMTTRNKKVLHKMDCDAMVELELLSEDDAWVMFQSYAGLSNSSSRSLIDLGRKISNECKRLPVAIAPIARSLKGEQNREEWKVTLHSLQKPISSIHTVDDHVIGIYKCLKVSYDYMKDEKAKGLFLLCSVFPEDKEISDEILTRFGIAAGIFGDDYVSYDNGRSQVVVAKNKLLNSCLLLETDEGNVKMHDMVRDVAQWIAKKEIQTVDMFNKHNKSLVERNKNIEYLLCEGKDVDVFSSRLDGSKLKILIVNFYTSEECNNMEVPTLLFESNLPGLRALHLNHINGRTTYHVPLPIPQLIQSLKNIRSLMINGVDLGDISIMGNLQNLETLELVCCTINELPTEITELVNFKLLKLQKCDIQRYNPFEVIGRCSSLEELYFIESFNSCCRDITFPKLQRYHVCQGFGGLTMNTSQSKIVAFDSSLYGNFFSKETFKYCMQTAEVLYLYHLGNDNGWRNLIPEIVPIDQGMNYLVKLYLSNISQLQHLVETFDHSHVPNVFSNLVFLTLVAMENLEELCNGPLFVDSLKNLEKIQVSDCKCLRSLFKSKLNLCSLKHIILDECPMLVSLFQLSTCRSLVVLEELEISQCKGLENIIIIGEDERIENELGELVVDGDNNNKSLCSVFPKLKRLCIEGCPQLKWVLPIFSALVLSVLESINIIKCDALRFIFSQYVELGSLKEIVLIDLPHFIDIFQECHHSMSLSVKGSSSTSIGGSKAQIQLDPMICRKNLWAHLCCHRNKYIHKSKTITSTKLPSVFEDQPHDYSISSESNSYIWKRSECLSRQWQMLCNIKEIHLSAISMLKSVFTLSVASKMMLETLTVGNCSELKHICVDTEDDNGGNNRRIVFPKLQRLVVQNCDQLEYMIGHCAHDHQHHHNEIHFHLPAMKFLNLFYLPSLIDMSPKNHRTTFPPLTELFLDDCSNTAIESISDFVKQSIPRSLGSTTIEEPGEVEHFFAMEWLSVINIGVENIFHINVTNGKQMKLGLEHIKLVGLPVTKSIFIGPKNSFALQNLTWLEIRGCEKIEIIFPTSVIRCLPELLHLTVQECRELKHIFEDDGMENQEMSNSHSTNSCFPKLKFVTVIKCDMLKCVFPVSISKRLPELMVLIIAEANELKEIFRSEGDQKYEIQNLKGVVFDNLPSLSQDQGIQFHGIHNRFVRNCQQLCLTTSDPTLSWIDIFSLDYESWVYLSILRDQLIKEEENIKDFGVGNEVHAALGHEELMNEQSKDQQCLINQQHSLAETDTPTIHVKGNNCLKEIEDQETSTSEKTITAVLSTNSEAMNKPSTQLVASKQEDSKKGVGEETSSSTHLDSGSSSSGTRITPEVKTSSHDDGDGQIVIPSTSIATEKFNIRDSQETTKTNDFPVGAEVEAASGHELISSQELLNEQRLMNQIHPHAEAGSTIKHSQGDNCTKRNDENGTTSANGKTVVSSTYLEASSSPSRLSLTSNCKTSSQDDGDGQIAMPSLSTAMEDAENLSSPSHVIRELEPLVSQKHLAYENLSLLTDFLVKHPSICLRDNSVSNRYKGYAYSCLAELLKFLQTHSVLDVLGSTSNQSEFLELLQDMRRFGFDKEWLDGVDFVSRLTR